MPNTWEMRNGRLADAKQQRSGISSPIECMCAQGTEGCAPRREDCSGLHTASSGNRSSPGRQTQSSSVACSVVLVSTQGTQGGGLQVAVGKRRAGNHPIPAQGKSVRQRRCSTCKTHGRPGTGPRRSCSMCSRTPLEPDRTRHARLPTWHPSHTEPPGPRDAVVLQESNRPLCCTHHPTWRTFHRKAWAEPVGAKPKRFRA